MEKRKIILDCDPGHDDAIAIMMAAENPKIDLLGITIVAGNQTLEKTLKNGLNVCQELDIDIPVYSGMPLPMVREQVVAANVHGESGLDGGPVHDATCIAYLIEPSYFETQSMYTTVDIKSELSYGRTVCDVLDVLKKPHNTKVGMNINVDGFWDVVEACIRNYS